MIEVKEGTVRVTYLAASLKVNWALSGGSGFSWIRREGPEARPWILDSKEERNKCYVSFQLDSKETEVWGVLQNRKR